MCTEEQYEARERYLFADEYFSDKSINIWKKECSKRSKVRGELFRKFTNWVREENQIAVFTLHAYADFEIPKKFDCIFRFDKPNESLKVNFELTQSIYGGWFPIDRIEHGHKHLCIFTFEKEIPDILFLLHKMEGKFSKIGNNQIKLGFCNLSDLESIINGFVEKNK